MCIEDRIVTVRHRTWKRQQREQTNLDAAEVHVLFNKSQ